jgi:hypothetical protein
MPELPFLIFPRPAVTKRKKLGGGAREFRRPDAAQQGARLQQKFQQIAESFQNVQAVVAGIEPEQVIVMETVTASVENVARAAAQIPGLEWLAEKDLADVEPEFGFQDEDEPTSPLSSTLYALMSSQQAMQQLISLWTDWVQDPTKKARNKFGPFKQLFSLLRDIRRWGPQDRINETGVLDQWSEDVEVGAMKRFEIEFWFRSDLDRRQEAYDAVDNIVRGLGGVSIDQAAIPEIRYHAALVELPGPVARQFVDEVIAGNYSDLLRSEGVMFFRPRAQSIFGLRPIQQIPFELAQRLQQQPVEDGDPIVAILDGLPVANHNALRNRLILDDPEGVAALYTPGQQQHGTSITSIVLHGDLNGRGPALKRRVYVRPVLQPGPFNREVTPDNVLLVDLIHRAVRRIFEADGQQQAVAPNVRILNLSLGNSYQPFDREMSPLGRLIDWLAWKYKILIVVSSGNQNIPITLQQNDWRDLGDEEFIQQVLRAMQTDQLRRRLLSPAEGINCLSVGAVHSDEAPEFAMGDRLDLFRGRRLPSPIGTVANGFKRSTKPEILFPGGRLLFRQDPNGGEPPVFSAVDLPVAPGVLGAAPGIAPMELNRVSHSCGTSNAAALSSRCAALAYERISQMEIPVDSEPLSNEYHAVLLKALLVHGASWGDAASIIESAFPEVAGDWRKLERLKQQFLGYGEVEIERCLSADDHRATLLGWTSIFDGEGHQFSLPLPPSLAAKTELRRLIITLAWLTPTNQKHKDYRGAHLWITVAPGDVGADKNGLDAMSARRGTVEHRIFEGSKAVPFVDGDKLVVSVSCKEDAGQLDTPVPYAIAVTLEVGPNVEIDVYEEIKTRIRQPVVVETNA